MDDAEHFVVPEDGSWPSERVRVRHVSGCMAATEDDAVAVEEPLEIRLIYSPDGRPGRERHSKAITVTMRTPGHDAELAAGFLLTEGVVRDRSDVVAIRSGSGLQGVGDKSMQHAEQMASDVDAGNPVLYKQAVSNTVLVEIAPDVTISLPTLERNFYMTSSCGVCGKGSLMALRSVCPPRLASDMRVQAEVLHRLPRSLREAQAAFHATGGLHGTGLFTSDGELLLVREDVGRHNAVDKLVGAKFLADELPLREHVLLLSGRASFELLQKAVMAGIGVVAAVGAPSSLAVRLAREFGVTLVGFLRDGRFNIYNGAERIEGLQMAGTVMSPDEEMAVLDEVRL